MKAAQKLTLLLPLVQVGHEAALTLPPKQRAAMYEAIALVTQGLDEHLHGHAAATAQALREAEGHQLTFAALLNQSTPKHS
jgi:hypothetical protein